MGSETSGNRELSYSFQNSKNREEAEIKLKEIKDREKTLDKLTTIKIVDGRQQIEEYYYSRNTPSILTSNPCRCLVRKLFYETYILTPQNEEVDIIIINYKNLLKIDKNSELNVLLGYIFEQHYLEIIN